jgi:hypothetical protein
MYIWNTCMNKKESHNIVFIFFSSILSQNKHSIHFLHVNWRKKQIENHSDSPFIFIKFRNSFQLTLSHDTFLLFFLISSTSSCVFSSSMWFCRLKWSMRFCRPKMRPIFLDKLPKQWFFCLHQIHWLVILSQFS